MLPASAMKFSIYFFTRLETYTKVSLTVTITAMAAKVMISVLSGSSTAPQLQTHKFCSTHSHAVIIRRAMPSMNERRMWVTSSQG